MPLDVDRFRLPSDRHRKIFEVDIEPGLFAAVKASDAPRAIVFGGQPGAGKSYAMRAAVAELGGPAAAVDIVGDNLRGYHPEYGQLLKDDDKLAAFYTDADVGRWVEMAIDVAAKLRVPVAVEGTMRNPDKVAQTLHLLRQAGYKTEARALAVPPAQSWQAVLLRYEGQRMNRGAGRMTTPQAHRDAYEGLPLTLERIERDRLADRVSVHRRDGKVLYWHEVATGLKSEQTTASRTVEIARLAPMSLGEQRLFVAQYARLEAMLRMPERHASEQDIQNVAQLRSAAQNNLYAEAFRSLPEHQAVKEYPELQGSFDALRAIAHLMGPLSVNADTMARKTAREQVARHIEQGILAPATIKPAVPVQTPPAPSRSR